MSKCYFVLVLVATLICIPGTGATYLRRTVAISTNSSSSSFAISTNSSSSSSSEECSSVHDKPPEKRCAFVQDNCEEFNGIIPYMDLYYCQMVSLRWLYWIVFAIWLICLIFLLDHVAEEHLCPTLVYTSQKLRMSPEVAGVTLLAFGNAAGDIFSTIAGILTHNSFDISIGELNGAGLFASTICLGVVSAVAAPLVVGKFNFIRDVAFYLASLVIVLIFVLVGSFQIWSSLILLLVYAVYAAMIIVQWYRGRNKSEFYPPAEISKEEAQSLLSPSEDTFDDRASSMKQIPSPSEIAEVLIAEEVESVGVKCGAGETDEAKEKGKTEGNSRWDRFKQWFYEFNELDEGWIEVVLYLLLFPVTFMLRLAIPRLKDKKWNKYFAAASPFFCLPLLYIFFGADMFTYSFSSGFPAVVLAILGVLIVSFGTLLAHRWSVGSVVCRWFFMAWCLFFSIGCLGTIADELVTLLMAAGLNLHISEAVLGLTVLAWGNSLDDFVSDFAVARRGHPQMAVAGIFGASICQTMFGLGVTLTVYTMSHSPHSFDVDLNVQVAMSFIFLGCCLVAILVVVPLCRFRVYRIFGIILVVVYVIFNILIVLWETVF